MWIDNRLGQYPQYGTANGSLTSVSQVGDVGVPNDGYSVQHAGGQTGQSPCVQEQRQEGILADRELDTH